MSHRLLDELGARASSRDLSSVGITQDMGADVLRDRHQISDTDGNRQSQRFGSGGS